MRTHARATAFDCLLEILRSRRWRFIFLDDGSNQSRRMTWQTWMAPAHGYNALGVPSARACAGLVAPSSKAVPACLPTSASASGVRQQQHLSTTRPPDLNTCGCRPTCNSIQQDKGPETFPESFSQDIALLAGVLALVPVVRGRQLIAVVRSELLSEGDCLSVRFRVVFNF